MRRQWVVVLGVVAVLIAGAVMMVHNAPPRIEVGARAPDFTALDLASNRPVSLDKDFRGTVTLVNVWATYCEPCKQEIPAMDSLFRTLGGKEFRIAAVSIDPGSPDKVRDFAKAFGISFDVLHDPAGAITEKYQTTGVPESFLVDRNGRIVRIVQHAAAWNSPEVRRIVEDLLAAPGQVTAAPRPFMRRQWLTVGIIVVFIGLGAWGVTRFAPPAEGVEIGRRAPDYRVLRLATGDSIGLRSGFKGHVTLINLWATWCGPCRTEMPSMETVYREFKDRGFRIAAVSIDDGAPASVREYAVQLGLSFDILHDRSGFIQRAYQSVGVPQSFLIDRSGRIVYTTLGPEDWASPQHRAQIEHFLAARD